MTSGWCWKKEELGLINRMGRYKEMLLESSLKISESINTLSFLFVEPRTKRSNLNTEHGTSYTIRMNYFQTYRYSQRKAGSIHKSWTAYGPKQSQYASLGAVKSATTQSTNTSYARSNSSTTPSATTGKKRENASSNFRKFIQIYSTYTSSGSTPTTLISSHKEMGPEFFTSQPLTCLVSSSLMAISKISFSIIL